MQAGHRSTAKIAFDLLTAEDDGRVCKDIPESACRDQPQNFLLHVVALSFTKTADGFINPKLVLSWLLLASALASLFGERVVLSLFAAMSFAAMLSAYKLQEAQSND